MGRQALFGRLFVLPWVIGFLLFFAIPLLRSLYFTFCSIEIQKTGYVTRFIGLENYKFAFTQDPEFLKTFTQSIQEMVFHVPIIVVFSLFVATLLNQKFRGRFLARAVFFLPVIVTSGVIMQLLKEDIFAQTIREGSKQAVYMFKSSGIERILMEMGLNASVISYFTNVINSIFDLSWKSGVQILIFLAGLQSIPKHLYEAAHVEGCTHWEAFWKITFPMISPIILLNLVYSVIDSFTDYGNGMMTLIYTQGIVQLRYANSSTIAWIYMLAIFLIIGIVNTVVSRKVFYAVD